MDNELSSADIKERLDRLERMIASKGMSSGRVQPKATLASLYTPKVAKVQKKEEPGGFAP